MGSITKTKAYIMWEKRSCRYIVYLHPCQHQRLTLILLIYTAQINHVILLLTFDSRLWDEDPGICGNPQKIPYLYVWVVTEQHALNVLGLHFYLWICCCCHQIIYYNILCCIIPYPSENKPPPPPAQTGEGAYFRIFTMQLQYKPPL